jgi:trehalose 6-phosphate synthase/phosphatase
MVPFYVKKSFEHANIGLFFHSPFPSSAHFKSHKYRFEIIKSLMHCDLVAFHLFMYASNFFKTCNRVCGFEIEFRRGGFLGINFHGKHVMIRVSHIGIEESFIEELINTKKFKNYQRKLKDEMKIIGQYLNANRVTKETEGDSSSKNASLVSNFEQPIVMTSIDTFHPISGLKNKLLSYQLFLQKYPRYQNRIVLIVFITSIV